MALENKQGLYEVGYGKPPQWTRFQKGKSGNPGGQKKGRAKISEALVRLISMPLRIYHNYTPRSVAEEIAMKLIDMAVDAKKGVNLRAIKELFDRTEGKPGYATYLHYPTGEIEIVYEDWKPPQLELEKGDFYDAEHCLLYPAGYLDEAEEESSNVA